ncbi:structure-specific endonuclease subunit SLX4-like [Entelurus aequoreus]|uniref:structure-specific endonuclease subunit SLX4-like n=1 Tax=Entelurus aequoreus TaxID=161455 RepID=UPI002B1E622D|nr:structure-specific endonuclease subunit SLX4-like [Entelurus aequoreus]XP_061889359.1 structure-specific endonuclease subunit SLX4-like [Entelurus aequoreus]XP_061889360.1 structure-specific endonuclease subunit SLX4-like [Entelurus aequoreus]XP_061889361.1 structure-specific endonuclease subunit SLX4-like [Entelurus aequoreus]
MNDSDQDFVDLCSKTLKRFRKKVVEPKQQKRAADKKPSSQPSDGDKKGKQKEDDASHRVATGSPCLDVDDSGDAVAASGQKTDNLAWRRVEIVLKRMQHFKRASPPRMAHKSPPIGMDPEPPQTGVPQSSVSDNQLRSLDSDEVLAMRLQQELDREAAEAHNLDLEDGGLFFCQICHKDMSHMTPEGRTQHINRCLDDTEHQIAAPHPPLPRGVPDCPICGKKFKSQRSRSTHLKRCSSDMGVSPADLLQAVQRQAEETQSAAATNVISQTGGAKRKGTTTSGLPARKKPRKKNDPLDEDTMVALALSSSLLEQQKAHPSASNTETASHSTKTAVLKWRSDGGKGRGKRKKDTVPRPPPILLIQDADAALMRLQERVSALLLRTRAPSPPTPTRCASKLSVLNGAAPLWEKSALLNGDATGVWDFFVPELKDFFTPWKSAQTVSASSHTNDKPSSSLQPLSEGTTITKDQTLLSAHTTACPPVPSAPTAGQLPASSQALRDLVELADDVTALSYCDHTGPGDDQLSTNLQLSGFILDERVDFCVSGFLPETVHPSSKEKSLCSPGVAEEGRSQLSSGALSTLVSNLSSMVNNPQLSDLQLQVDTGEVFFAHSFMVYARCPLLAQMLHLSGFGVKEEGMPAAQRVLISDIPAQAVLVLLQYLYTAQVSLSSSLQPHVLELASRFDLQELQQLCESYTQETSAEYDDGDFTNHGEPLSSRTDKDLTALFNSMWSHEDDADDSEGDDESAVEKAKGETHEERVNQEELDEIYEFAATQRKREEEEMESVDDSEGDDGGVTSKRTPEESNEKNLDRSSGSSYSRLFSDTFCYPSQKKNLSSSKSSAKTLLQSSASVGSDLSPSTSSLPVPGVSPDQEVSCVKETTAVQHDSPYKSALKEEPELIVLSDSDNSRLSFTQLRPEESTGEKKQSSSLELSPNEPSPNQAVENGEQMNADCSPELSWLIPPTPVCSSPTRTKTGRDCSTQTKNSMRRTQLFPKDDCSVTSAFNNSAKAPDGILTAMLEEVDSPVFAKPQLSTSSHRHVSSKHETSLQRHTEPYSSTPLHTWPPCQGSPRSPFESPEKTEIGSLHFSPFCVAPHTSPQRHSPSPAKLARSRVTSEKEKLEPEFGRRSTDEGEARQSSFEQHFMAMDEPPMAFNDSWGFHACDDAARNSGFFSLRLEDSGGADQGEHREEKERRDNESAPSTSSHLPPISTNLPTLSPSPTDPNTDSLLAANVWDSWGEEEEEILPLSQRLNPSAQLKTPKSSGNKRRRNLVPITPMPHYSDLDTPELKNKLNSFGVRALPKRQMIVKLKEIHRYTHQLLGSDDEDEALSKRPPSKSSVSSNFKEPGVPVAVAPGRRHQGDEADAELLSNSQGSNASSTTASEESERSNPELCLSSGGDSDDDISASQAVTRLRDRLQAVRSFILSDSDLYGQILQYQPLVLSQLQQRLKAAGIRLGAAKLVDYLDSQCITFTTAKPGQPARSRRRVRKAGKKGKGGAGVRTSK